MPRVKRGVIHTKRRKNVLKLAKGYRWGRATKLRLARVAVLKAGVHAYVDRKKKKRNNRQLQQVRINAAVRPMGLSYSRFIDMLKKANVNLDRKVLSRLAANYPTVFEKVVDSVRK
ncbi:MAG: 50S ribosomal protein L20 [bacterium]|nr:50S ribosomal protein L20 [bacterium]